MQTENGVSINRDLARFHFQTTEAVFEVDEQTLNFRTNIFRQSLKIVPSAVKETGQTGNEHR